MLLKLMAYVIWALFMGLTIAVVVNSGMMLGGSDGMLMIGVGVGGALLASFGALGTFSIWDRRKGTTRGALGIVIAIGCWSVGEFSIVLNELTWRSAVIDAKASAHDDAALTKSGARKRLKKAQDALAALPEVRSAAAIATEETAALAETVSWKHEKRTLGSVTNNCKDAEHDLYRRCAMVLKLRAEHDAAIATAADRERLEADIAKEENALGTTHDGANVNSGNKWLAARSGHDVQTWDTVSMIITLLLFALGRDGPSCVIGALRDDGEREALADGVEPAARTEPAPIDVGEALRGVKIVVRRLEAARVISIDAQPAVWPRPVMSITMPALKCIPHEPVRESQSAPATPLALPAPTLAPTATEPRETAKKRAPAAKQEWPANVRELHPVDRRPGWETRAWLRETLSGGPQTRAEIVRLAAERNITPAALDRAAKSMAEVSITPGKGKRPAV